MLMNRKNLKDWNSGTVNKILRRHPNGFAGFVVVGERGMGKSTYAYKVMAKIYQLVDELDEYDAYRKALDHIIFQPKDLINLIEHNISKDFITPVICLDDATVHFNSYKFFVDLHEVILLKGMFDTIRTAITGLIMTCPTGRNLLKFLKDYDDYKIQVMLDPDNGNSWNRLARCYRFNYYPDDRKYRVWVDYQDHYSCYIPNEPYGWYISKRKKYLEMINTKMKELIKVKEKMKKN